jgi:hypothetical protein
MKGRGHEREHAHREETDFKTLARRNKLLGLWAAEQLGIHGDAADAYAKDVIYADLEEPGEDDITRTTSSVRSWPISSGTVSL